MPDEPNLHAPCPCGSGDAYKDCCFHKDRLRKRIGGSRGRSKKRTKRPKATKNRRRRDDENSDRRTSDDSKSTDPQKSDPTRTGPNDQTASNSPPRSVLTREDPGYPKVERGSQRLSEVTSAAFRAYNRLAERQTRSHIGELLSALGVPPEISADARPLVQLYGIYGREELGGTREDLVRSIEIYERHALADDLQKFRRSARLFAFEWDPDGGTLSAHTGLDTFSLGGRPKVVTARDVGRLPQGIYVGLWFAWEGARFFYCPTALSDAAADTLRDAAADGAWGTTEETFRRVDYEADILTLAVDPNGRRREDSDGRIVRGSLTDRPSIADPYHAVELFNDLLEGGLPSEGADPAWHVALARADSRESVELLTDALERRRDHVFAPRHRFFEFMHTDPDAPDDGPPSRDDDEPYGAFTDEEFLAWLGLSPDGSIELPRVERWPRHHVADLELADDAKARLDLLDDLPLAAARKRVDERGAGDAVEAFERALRLHRRRLRWLALMDRWQPGSLARDDRQYGIPYPPILSDWIAGARAFFEDDIYRRPVQKLPDQDGRYRDRLAGRAAEQLPVDDPVRICDLPDSRDELLSLSGVGEKTVDRYVAAVVECLSGWPDEDAADATSSILRQSTGEARAESTDKIDSALDDLDDLF